MSTCLFLFPPNIPCKGETCVLKINCFFSICFIKKKKRVPKQDIKFTRIYKKSVDISWCLKAMSTPAFCHKFVWKEFQSRVCQMTFLLVSSIKLMRSFILLPWCSEDLENTVKSWGIRESAAALDLLHIIVSRIVLHQPPKRCPHPNPQNLCIYYLHGRKIKVADRI